MEKDGMHGPRKGQMAPDGLARPLVALAALVVVIGGMRAAAPLLTQVLVIAFATIVLSPLYYALRRMRLPSWLAVASIILAVAGVCAWALVYVLPPALADFSRNLPHYHGQMLDAARDAESWLARNDFPVPRGYLVGIFSSDSAWISNLAKSSLAVAGKLVENGVIVLVIVAFMLAELPRLPHAMRTAPWMTPERIRLLTKFAADVRRYMGIKTIVSAATGALVYAGLRLLGVGSPVLLGVAAFVFNFVPAIGSVIAAVPGVLLALGSGGPGVGVAAAALYLVVNQVLGNIIEPRLMGAGFGVSPVVVLLSAVFWSWVLGPVGMLLAVPLTMAVRGTAISAFPEKKPDNVETEK